MSTFGASALVVWAQSLIVGERHLRPEVANTFMALVGIVPGIGGVVAGGYLGDWFTRRRGRGGHAQAIGVSLIAAVPFGVASLLITHEVTFMALTAITVFLLSVYNGPAAAVIDELGPPRFAATLQSFAMFWIHVLGNAPAGSVVGWIADRSSVAFGLQAAVAAMGIVGRAVHDRGAPAEGGDHLVTTTQQYYDRFSETYENERHRGYHRLIDELELDLVRRYGAGKDVFEAGCGTGLLLREAAEVARSAVGLDLSRGMLAPARDRGLRVVQGSLTDVPLPSASFDLVYSMKVLAHVPPIERAVAELARLVRPGGHLLLEFYNPFSLRYLAKRLGGPGRIAGDGTDESHVFTRFDRPSRARSYLPGDLQVVSMRGVRVVTPSSHVFAWEPLGKLFSWAERAACDLPLLRNLGGFLILVARKSDGAR